MKRLIAAMVALSLVSAAPVAGADSGTQPDDGLVVDLADVAAPAVEDPVSASEFEDLKTIAGQRGLSLQEAIDRYAWNDNFALAAASIRQTAPDAFSDARIIDGKNARIAFADGAPAVALTTIKAFQQAHPAVAVAVDEGLGFTEIDLEEAVPAVHYAVLGAPGIKDVTTSFDLDLRQIKVVVVGDGALGDRALSELRATATDSLADAGLDMLQSRLTVNVVEAGYPVLGGNTANNEHIGGEAIAGCTTGFAVRSAAGINGISTAGHCDNGQTDDGQALDFQAGHQGQQGGFQWHTGPQAEPDDFYAGADNASEVNRRDVAAIGAPVVGQSLCKNGMVGFKDCGDVIQLNVCHFDVCNLVQMDARRATGGDSGGPVYWGNTAYGLHKGWRYDPVWPFDRDLFSRADRIDNALGVNVRS